MSINNIIPVILCGGTGSRLWPLSRESFPKQYLEIDRKDKVSFLQGTVNRIKNFPKMDNPIIVCNEDHRFIAAEQLRNINIKPKSILLEPIGRNTAPAITAACLKAKEEKEDPYILVLPADHIIQDNDVFFKVINKSLKFAEEGKIVTFGVTPFKPETGFGYIESENELSSSDLNGELIVRFIEKPDKEKAEELIQDKRFSWNSGIFFFKVSTLLKEIISFHPNIYKYCKKALLKKSLDLDFQRLDQQAMEHCPSISIDVAIMEKTKLGSVVPLDAQWSDIGTWNSLWESQIKDNEGNLSQGKVLLKDVKNSIFRSESRLIVGMGVKNLVAVETNDAVLIMNKDKSQEIKGLVSLMKEKGLIEASEHKRGYRPWGSYLSIANGENWLVKLIEVNPGASLSLQKHNFRAEHWIVVKGIAEVRIEDEKTILKENQSTFIPLGALHQLSNPNKTKLKIIEVQSGPFLSEEDIERFDDMYGRV